MNSILNYSIKRIIAGNTSYILRLQLIDEVKILYLYNAGSLENNLVAVERRENMFLESKGDIICDLTLHGKYGLTYNKGSKISFVIEGTILNGSYMLILPSWGKDKINRMWLFFRTN